MDAKPDKGFTLVEVMVALAVAAIVATPLFQMFVTTSYINKDAKLTDAANVIAVRQAESFKADPESYDPAAKYYDMNGEGVSAAKAVIKVDSTVTASPLANTLDGSGYFPNFAGTIDLTPYIEMEKDPLTGFDTDQGCDIQITSANKIEVGLHGTVLSYLPNQDSTNIKNSVVPIKVSFTSGTQSSRTINLINDSSAEAAVYFFAQDSSQVVTLNPVSGPSSITRLSLADSTATVYDLELKVSKIVGDTAQTMFTYSANKYVYY